MCGCPNMSRYEKEEARSNMKVNWAGLYRELI